MASERIKNESMPECLQERFSAPKREKACQIINRGEFKDGKQNLLEGYERGITSKRKKQENVSA